MSRLNDISLVAQVVVFKNTKAFDRLVQKYQSPVRRFFLHLTCGDSELSDDLAQDTFIKAYTHIASFQNLSSFSTWLYRIAYNVFYDYIRSRKETAELNTREVDAFNSTEQENVGRKMDIYQSLNTLKEVERTCITLFYMEDVSIDKIAGITGLPAGTVKSHLSRGKDKLAAYLKQNGYDRSRQ
ncbi:sigma-70 family RNA polymerase sigma factor [uncultured Bacteroides sp.]|uniref:RNA polymerase sigma factor n=1 Tax=uncultured Bacteroides sp. TaxID=162156 RepID=UPI0025F0AB90|nr:sigma-70 family RNA polymerase sigma factor [uncultured Bacteroides sp.]